MAINPQIDTATGFREMTLEDVERVMEIEREVYEHTWTEGIFRDCLRVGYSCWVYEYEKEVRAYGLVAIAANEAHILNIVVAAQYQGQGLGKLMLWKLVDVADRLGVDSIFLEVRESNHVAINLYEKEGFNRIGLRKNYYPANEGREDAFVFARALNISDVES